MPMQANERMRRLIAKAAVAPRSPNASCSSTGRQLRLVLQYPNVQRV